MPSVWYHGTYRENEASIGEHGLRATYYGDNFQGFGIGTPYLTLFKDRSNAPLPGRVMPSETTLMQTHGLARGTVRKAIDTLA